MRGVGRRGEQRGEYGMRGKEITKGEKGKRGGKE